jgi:hypothetical protein
MVVNNRRVLLTKLFTAPSFLSLNYLLLLSTLLLLLLMVWAPVSPINGAYNI